MESDSDSPPEKTKSSKKENPDQAFLATPSVKASQFKEAFSPGMSRMGNLPMLIRVIREIRGPFPHECGLASDLFC
jgi:hypothetical protein